MRILCKGDQHLKHSQPAKRTDNFYESQFKKHDFIFEYALENRIDLILQPGDFFDTPKIPISLFYDYIRVRTKYSDYGHVPEIAVYGQHDIFFHSMKELKGTPLNLLSLLGLVNIPPYQKDEVCVYGASWGEEIPEIEDKEKFNILLTHRMVIKDEKLWHGQEKFELSRHLLRNTKFDLIVSGDNHQTFTDSFRGRHLINAGSIMRTSIAQVGHIPCFFVYDTEEDKIERVDIPHKEKVFDTQFQETEEKSNEEVKVFIDSLSQKSYQELSFRRNLIDAMFNAPDGVSKIVQDIIKRSGLDGDFKNEKSRRLEETTGNGRGTKEKTGLGKRVLRKRTA